MATVPNLPMTGQQLRDTLVEIDNETTAWADVTGKPATFPPAAHSHAWGDVTGKPSTFAPAAHTHAIADVTGLQAALDAKGTIVSFATDAEAQAYSAANPTHVVLSRQGV